MITFNYDGTATLRRAGFDIRISTEHDSDSGAPWNEECGHGPVSEWTTRDKAPGEIVLSGDRGSKRYYDMAEACRIARSENWGSLYPYNLELTRTRNGAHIATAKAPRYGYGSSLPDIASKPRRDINRAVRELYAAHRATFPSARAYAANAARADFERLRAWCNDEWYYCTVIVTASRNGIKLGSTAIGGTESDYAQESDYIPDLIDEAIAEARDTLRRLTDGSR